MFFISLFPDLTSVILITESLVIDNEIISTSLLLDVVIFICVDFFKHFFNFLHLKKLILLG